MGNELHTRVELGGESAEAKVLLETEELILRGALKARIPFRDMTAIRVEDGVLAFRWSGRDVRIHAGRDAAKWAEKIRNPKSVLDKLGVKAAQKISIVGDVDGAFEGELQARGADISRGLRRDSDVIFFAANRKEELAKLAELRRSLQPAGAIWILRPKGSAAISEADVMAAGKAAGLVDVKVVRFSATHTAEKFVIPNAKRP